jgi:twitching motility two-component system response regulator PilH
MGKVLVVDDDPGITLLLKRVIAKKGHQILIASNGWEGLKLAQANLPDLVFTDVRMPDLGGVELAGFLKADPLLQHIPVIILSGTAYLLDLEQTEADDILTKPFDLRAVYALLERYLGKPDGPPAPQKEDSGSKGTKTTFPSISESSQDFTSE